tara:strand:+ start:740 stop:1231 length:492 start_codon:yes stop_codon:yes gene_type:complete
MHILIKNKKLYFNDYRIKCALGKRGIGTKKKEGDLITPKGLYKIRFILYRKDRVKNLKTKKKKLIIKKNMGWCNDSNSKSYNKLIKLPFKFNYEKLFRSDRIYDIVLVLNYNMSPIKKNKGSAIFVHIAKKNFKSTEGCVAIKKRDLQKIASEIKNNTKVKIF